MAPKTDKQQNSQMRVGSFTIARAMVLGGVAIVGGLGYLAYQQHQTISNVKIGGEPYLEIASGKDLIADILPPPLYPVDAFAMAHISEGSRELFIKLKPKMLVMQQQFTERLAFWNKQLSESSLLSIEQKDLVLGGISKHGEVFWSLYETELIPALDRADSVATAAAIDKLSKEYLEFYEFIDGSIPGIATAVTTKQATLLDQANADKNFLTAANITLSAAIMLMLLAAYIFVVRAISRISDSMATLASGKLDTEVPYDTRKDEIGMMSHAVGVFKQQAIENHSNEQNSEFIIRALGEGLENLSKGNLTFRLSERFPEGMERLRDYFNSAADSLQDTISSVKSGTDGIKSGTEEIAQASDDLSRRTENQAANLEETAAAVAEITAAVRKTATGAVHARGVVNAAKDEADKSGEVVRKAVEAMRGIEKSSQQINQIIGVIDEIAFQTNLLALNAGVEAARAGDAGRGFAVVASEVRALAQRSADAAKEIKGLLSTSRGQVEDGVKLVAETGDSLKQIIERVSEINSVVAEIAASAEQQASGLQEVNTAVDQMDQVTQQNAAMVEQATAATRTLTNQSSELARVVARFTTAAASAINRVIENSHKTAARAPMAPPVKKARIAAAGGESWEEF